MRYLQDWLPLAEARRLFESCDLSKDEAELDICRAIADRKICIRNEILQIYGEPRLPLELLVPRRLSPQDFDWEKSVTVTPWQEHISDLDRRLRPGRLPRRVTFSVEVSMHGIVRVCGRYPSESANKDSEDVPSKRAADEENLAIAVETLPPEMSSAPRRATLRSSSKRKRAARALDRIADKDHMTNVELCNEVQKILGLAARDISNETILRAAGRRK
jgi:hypothetical protein